MMYVCVYHGTGDLRLRYSESVWLCAYSILKDF